MKLPSDVQRILACPVCRGTLEVSANGDCDCTNLGCAATFPAVGGVPILINDARSVFSIAGFQEAEPTFFKPRGRLRRLVSYWLPDMSHNLTAKRDLEQMRDLLHARSNRPLVLIVGGGVVGNGIDALLNDPSITVVETDAALAPRTQLVCDGHDLPFRDESFDGVVAQAVLHHVVDASRCVAEMHRILKPDGLVYADSPFMVQVHGREFDFARFTLLGYRRLFRQFREISVGMTSGPGTALAWSLRYFLLSFTASQTGRRLVGGVSRLAFAWLRYLDHLVKDKPAALDAAAAFSFLGEKQSHAIADRDLLASYRGGM